MVFYFQDFLKVIILLFPVSFEPVFPGIVPVTVNKNAAVDMFQQGGIGAVDNDHFEGCEADFFRSDPVFCKNYKRFSNFRLARQLFP